MPWYLGPLVPLDSFAARRSFLYRMASLLPTSGCVGFSIGNTFQAMRTSAVTAP